MTLVEKEGSDQTAVAPLNGESSQNLYRQLHEMNAANAEPGDAQEVQVRINQGHLLPPQTEVAKPSAGEPLAAMREELRHDALEASEGAMPPDSLPVSIERSPVELALEKSNKELVDGLLTATAEARTREELQQEVVKYLASYSEAHEGGVIKYVNDKPVLIVDDPQYMLVKQTIQDIEARFDKRANIAKARDGVSKFMESHRDSRAEKRYMKEARAENKEFDERRAWVEQADRVHEEAKEEAEKREMAKRGKLLSEKRKAEDELWDEAHTELLAFDERKAQEARDDALKGPGGFEDFVQQEIDKVIEPIKLEILRIQRLQSRLMAATDRMPLHDRKELETENAHELDTLYKKAAAERKKVIEKTTQERKNLTKGLRQEAASIAEFEDNLKADTYSYNPDSSMHPEMVALIAGANGAFVGAQENPIVEEDYDVKSENGSSSRMQRLVYRTDNPTLFVVEEWDRSSGKLKRQSFIKGTEADVLVKGKDNGARRFSSDSNKTELSNRIYEKLGPIDPKSLAGDTGTSLDEGSSTYIRNLTRSGGVSLAKAKELADPLRPKNKRTESFIEMLTKNLVKK